jgi:threonine dehydrogenase-like Zn-dependent dehydrogenase
VIGCGGLGIHGVQLAKVFGAGTIIAVDVLSVALERAKSLGADLVCRADQEDPVEVIKKATKGLGVDLALECVGQQSSIAMAVACVRAGGRAVVVGLGADNINTLPPTEFVRREIELKGSYGFTVREIAELVQLVDHGELDISGSISRTIALDEINEGLEALYRKIDNPVRIVVSMGS